MRMKTGISKAFSLVFAEKSTVAQNDVIDFISRAFSVQSMPFLLRLLTFPVIGNREICTCTKKNKQIEKNGQKNHVHLVRQLIVGLITFFAYKLLCSQLILDLQLYFAKPGRDASKKCNNGVNLLSSRCMQNEGD